MMIYLDHNATTPVYDEVVEVVARQLRETFANPGSPHAFGRKARRVLEAARESMAAVLGADPDEVVFTSGGTEANNMAILGFTEGPPGTLVLTAGEHPSVLEAARVRQRSGWEFKFLPVDNDGRLRPIEALPASTRLAAVILAHNETGVIQDVSPLAAVCSEARVPLHLDAVQAVGKIDIDFHRLGAASLSLGAHKFGGPRGVGALLLRKGWRPSPIAFGGHQEAERRPGTECVPLIAGMARALELFHAESQERQTRSRSLRDLLQAGLLEQTGPAIVNGSREHRLPNTLNIAFPGIEGEALLAALDLAGIACSLGSTCASGSAEPAPALLAMGLPLATAKSTIRLSLGASTTETEIGSAIEIISQTVKKLRMS